MQGFECAYISSHFIHPVSQHVFMWYIYIFRLSRFCLLFSLGVVTIYNRFNLCISSIKIFNQLNCYLSFILSSCKFFFCVCVFFVLCYFVPGWHSVSKCWTDLCLPPKRFCVLSERWDEHTNLFSFLFLLGGGGGECFVSSFHLLLNAFSMFFSVWAFSPASIFVVVM